MAWRTSYVCAGGHNGGRAILSGVLSHCFLWAILTWCCLDLQVLQKARGVEDVEIELGDITEAARQSRMIKSPYLTIIKRKYRPQLFIACIFMIFQQFDVSPPHLMAFWTDHLWHLKLALSACSLSFRSESVAWLKYCQCAAWLKLALVACQFHITGI